MKKKRSRVFLFRKTITVATRRLSRVTRIATVTITLSADATYDNKHINTHTRTSTAQNGDRTKRTERYNEATVSSTVWDSLFSALFCSSLWGLNVISFFEACRLCWEVLLSGRGVVLHSSPKLTSTSLTVGDLRGAAGAALCRCLFRVTLLSVCLDEWRQKSNR